MILRRLHIKGSGISLSYLYICSLSCWPNHSCGHSQISCYRFIEPHFDQHININIPFWSGVIVTAHTPYTCTCISIDLVLKSIFSFAASIIITQNRFGVLSTYMTVYSCIAKSWFHSMIHFNSFFSKLPWILWFISCPIHLAGV